MLLAALVLTRLDGVLLAGAAGVGVLWLDPDRVVADIKKSGGEAVYIPQVEDIVDYIAENSESGDVVLVMSSGGFFGIHQKLLNRL